MNAETKELRRLWQEAEAFWRVKENARVLAMPTGIGYETKAAEALAARGIADAFKQAYDEAAAEDKPSAFKRAVTLAALAAPAWGAYVLTRLR